MSPLQRWAVQAPPPAHLKSSPPRPFRWDPIQAPPLGPSLFYACSPPWSLRLPPEPRSRSRLLPRPPRDPGGHIHLGEDVLGDAGHPAIAVLVPEARPPPSRAAARGVGTHGGAPARPGHESLVSRGPRSAVVAAVTCAVGTMMSISRVGRTQARSVRASSRAPSQPGRRHAQPRAGTHAPPASCCA